MKYIARLFLILFLTSCILYSSPAQPLNQKGKFTHEDTLRGSIGPGRDWWNVRTYSIDITPDFGNKTIKGNVWISFSAKPGTNKVMQIDLQEPLMIDSIISNNDCHINKFWREGNAYFINFGNTVFKTNATPGSASLKTYSIKISYHGKPREAINPPWDGGWIWKNDDKGRPWVTVACQGLGASVWYPCKDHQSDEPDLGATLSITVPDSLTVVGNGKMTEKKPNNDRTSTWIWEVKNPINNYNIVPYIGKYVNFTDTMNGEKGKLDLSYWVLDYNLDKAKIQFDRDVKRMLRAFEYWFGPYPFYEDGYKLVESSHLGMEHQSATAYGNHYLNGYLGYDLSGSGWGLKWDYIIIHESGHEWFGNNITTNDIADMWVHEGFTMYSEALFIEYYYGKKAANEYVQGLRGNISNLKPLIGHYGVNQKGSGDMYNKGANLIHTIRQVIDDDVVFRKILRGLNKDFYHQTIDSRDVEAYFSKQSGKDLSRIFDQYLQTTKIPQLEYKTKAGKLSYRWANCIPGFEMPVRLEGTRNWLRPTAEWKEASMTADIKNNGLLVDKNFYVRVKKAG